MIATSVILLVLAFLSVAAWVHRLRPARLALRPCTDRTVRRG